MCSDADPALIQINQSVSIHSIYIFSSALNLNGYVPAAQQLSGLVWSAVCLLHLI